ncbi:hypothetical protein P0D88_53540, partial [Paraburkholderia sp. RL18-103-BIB-C]
MIDEREHFPVASTITIHIEHTRLTVAEPVLQSSHFFWSPTVRRSQTAVKAVVTKFEHGRKYRVESRAHSPDLQV